MKCRYPVTMTHPTTGLPKPRRCGQCMTCRLQRRNSWAGAMLLEQRLHKSSVFTTLTIEPEYLKANPNLSKRDLQLFLKRLRRLLVTTPRQGRLMPDRLRYYACGELGELSGRPHYHLVLFGLRLSDHWLIQKAWPHGFATTSQLIPERAAYVCKYMMKELTGLSKPPDAAVQPFALMSKKPGLGLGSMPDLAAKLLSVNEKQQLYIANGGRLPASSWRLMRDGPPEYMKISGKAYPLRKYLKEKLNVLLGLSQEQILAIKINQRIKFQMEDGHDMIVQEIKQEQRFNLNFKRKYNSTQRL